MSEPVAVAGLRKIRTYLLESISQAADEIKMIDDQLEEIYMNDTIQKDDHRFDGLDPDQEEAA